MQSGIALKINLQHSSEISSQQLKRERYRNSVRCTMIFSQCFISGARDLQFRVGVLVLMSLV